MKYCLFYFVMLSTLVVSCSKNESSPFSPKRNLVRTITEYAKTGYPDKEIDSFAYDDQNRVSYFIASIYSGSTFYSSSIYKLSYTSDGTVPAGYSLSYNPALPSYAIDNYSGEHIIRVNSQNQPVLDSILLNTNPNGINRYFEYGNNLIIHKWGGYGSDSLFYTFQMDSAMMDGDNVNQVIVGTNDLMGLDRFNYRWIWTHNYTYDNNSNPLFNPSAALVYYLARGFMVSRNCVLTYGFNSTDTSYSFKFRNNTDQQGLLQNTVNQDTGDSTIYRYY